MVVGFPVLAQAGHGQIPVRADLADHLAQIAAEVPEGQPAQNQ